MYAMHTDDKQSEEERVEKDLYFVPLLEKAFREPDRAEALRRAFTEIEERGRQEPYRVGHQQFCQFMKAAVIRPLPDIRLEREGNLLARVDPLRAAEEVRIAGLMPGLYAVRLSTGRLLWSGSLDATDLFWDRAFPGKPLRVAADSDTAPDTCSREFKLPGDEVLLRVYPGVESGTMGIRVRLRGA